MKNINLIDEKELVDRMAAYNLGFLPQQGMPTDRDTQVARLQDYMVSDRDADAAERVRQYYGEALPIKDVSQDAMEYFVGAAFARQHGISGSPEAYWLGQKLDMPEVESREDLYGLMGRDLIERTRKGWEEQRALANERQAAMTGLLKEMVTASEGEGRAALQGRFAEAFDRGVFSEDDWTSVQNAREAFATLQKDITDSYEKAGANVLTKSFEGEYIFDRLYNDPLAQALFLTALQERVQDLKTDVQERAVYEKAAKVFSAAGKELAARVAGGHFKEYVTDEQVEEFNAELPKIRERAKQAAMYGGKAAGERAALSGFAIEDEKFEKYHNAAKASGQLNEDGTLRKMTKGEWRRTGELNAFRGELYRAISGAYDVDGVVAGLAKMMPDSLVYLVPGGQLLGVASGRTQSLALALADEEDFVSANVKANVGAAIQAHVEKMAFGSMNPAKWVPGMDWLMSRKVVGRALGRIYGTTAGRIGMGLVAGVGEETFAEPLASLVLKGVYNAVAQEEFRFDDPLGEYQAEMAEMMKPSQILVTGLYGLLLGGVNVMGHRSAAADYREVYKELVAAGADEGRAAQAARDDEFAGRIMATKRVFEETLKEKPASVLGHLAEVYPQLQGLATMEAFFSKRDLPRVIPAENGQVKVQTSDEDGKVQEVVLSKESADLLVQAKLEELTAQELAQFADAALANAMVGAMSTKSDKWDIEVVAERMDGEYFERLANAAGVRTHGKAWQERMLVARHDYEQKHGEVTDEEWVKIQQTMVSRVNRTGVRGKDGRLRTLFRVARGGFGAMEVLEDITEDNLVRDMAANGRTLDYYVENLQELERALGKPGAFLRELNEGETAYDRMAVVEAMGKLVQSKVLADTAKNSNRFSAALNAFLEMIRGWVLQAKAMMKLGAAVNKVLEDKEAAKNMDAEFVAAVERLAEQDIEFLQELQLKEGLEAMFRVAKAAAENATVTPVLDEAEAEHGEQVRQEMAEKAAAQRKVDADVAVAEAALDGSMSTGEEPAAYYVIDDNVGLQERLDDIVDVVDISFVKDDGKNWLKEAKSYIAQIAGRVFMLENTDGYMVKMPEHRAGKDTAVKGIRKKHQFKAEVIQKFEEIFKKVVLLDKQTPTHKVKETEARRNRVDAVKAFYKFGWPVRINGTLKMFWFGADLYDESKEKELVFYEFGLQDVNEKGDSAVRTVLPEEEVEQGTESPSSGASLGDYLANVKVNPNQTRILPKVVPADFKEKNEGGTTMSVTEAQEGGLFVDGHLETSNAVVTEPGVSFSIEALHATPHRFRKFSTDKMGSGEGHQAFGWGLYFAENVDVNRDYHRQFSQQASEFILDGKRMHELDLIEFLNDHVKYDVADYALIAAREDGDIDSRIKKVQDEKKQYEEWLKKPLDSPYADWQLKRFIAGNKAQLKALRFVKKHKIKRVGASNYRVELNVDDGSLLMWDSPVSDELQREVELLQRQPDKAELDAVFAEMRAMGISSDGPKPENMHGYQVYNELARILGGNVQDLLSPKFGQGPRLASEWLLAHGIKGIKYFDGFSRVGKGEGKTYNYVIFSGDDVKITGVNETGRYDAPWEEYEDPTASFSVVNQEELVASLKAKPELQSFMDCVQRVEQMKARDTLDRKEHFFGVLPDKVINEVQKDLPVNIDLKGARLSLNAQDVWHMYRGHCLDSFMYDDQVSITYDDIRMIPDIVDGYDSVAVEKESKKWRLVFLKKYGDITYKYISEISRKHDWPKVRHATLKTGWLIKSTGAEDDFTSRQSQTQTVSHFPRTAIVTPLEDFIKQNFKDEARTIAEHAKNHDAALIAPNGIVSNLTPVQWLVVRLQTFKDWFGNWENDPENASKAMDENGEPKVYYHHTNANFTEFLHSEKGKTDAGWLGSGFYFYGIEDEGKGYGLNSMACFLNVRNPYYASDDDMFRLSEADSIEASEEFTESLIEDGYDGVYYDGDLRQEMMALEPNQIKSATDNRGTFDGGNPDITFSVVGEHAANWEKIKDRAFRGRDDGKLRVELDASGVRLKNAPRHRTDDSVADDLLRRLAVWRADVAMRGRLRAVQKAVKDGAWLEIMPELTYLVRQMAWMGLDYASFSDMQEAGLIELAVNEAATPEDAKAVVKGRKVKGVLGFNKLGEVLDFPELYEAYPELKQLPVRWMDDEFKLRGSYAPETKKSGRRISVRANRSQGGILSTLLHEVQHWIQDREGFAYGAMPGQVLSELGVPEGTPVHRLAAGEIEARNVQARRWLSAEERAALPFNETLAYPGEALSYTLEDLRGSFSVVNQEELDDIKAVAEKDGTFMKAPNGKPSKLTERQWLQVRTAAFKGWFGDWERAAELTFDGSEYNNETCLKMLVSEAGTPFVNDETGIEAEINNRQRGKITSGKAQRKSKESGFSTGVHNFVAAHIRRLFKHAVHVGDYRDKNQSDDVLAIKRFVCPVRIKGVEAFAYMTVKELKQHGHKIYTLELDTIERLGGNLDEHFEEMLNPAPSKGILARVNELRKTYFENVSKVVDENGEPKVVTHATNAEPFTVFRRGERAGLSGKGIYFSPDGVGIWGKNMMSCFLNVRNPLTKEKAPREVNNGGMSAVIPDVFERFPQFDGVMLRRDEITVRDPEQIKSATDNRGTFDGGNADITFSMERNLAAVHSIPVDTMLDVEKKLGGLPKPSIAITRLDKPYSWGYSERVYLIGKPELADPQKGNLVYDRDAWTGKGPFLLEDGGAYDYRKGEYFEPTLEEFVARTIKKKGQEDGSSFRGQSAVAIGTMDAVKAHREKLSDTDTSNAQKAVTDEALEVLIENVVKLSKKGLNEDEVATVMARVCWRSSPMKHGAPSEMKTSRDTAKRILNELGVRVKDIKKPLVDSFMKAVEGLQNELEDYLESVPQRAVMFNEWEYAVMPESMKGTPGLDEMLERNGIKPLWHDGTEEGRRAALAGLVGNADVSFSLFSPSEASGLKALQSAVRGKQDAVFRSDTLNADVMLPFGSAGVYKNPDNPSSKIVGAHGLLHIITARMAHGDSLEEATYTAAKAVLAAVNGRIVDDSSSDNKKELTLDGYNTWVYLKWRDENKAWVVTGYKANDKHTSVDDRQRAMNLAESYALNTFGGLERVGAALEYSIARVAREYKQNNANPFLKLDFSSSIVDLSEEDIAHGIAAAGYGFRANKEFGDQMLREIRASLQRMKKLGSKTRTDREDALAAMGGITHMVRALVQYLPRGYRFAVHPYMNRLEVLTELATTGMVEMLRENVSKGLQEWMDETSETWHEVLPKLSGNEDMTREELTERVQEMMKEHAGQQLTEAVERIVDRVANQLRKHAKDTAVKKMRELLERVQPKKDPKSGKMKGGKMSADDYRDLKDVQAALDMNAEKLEAKLAALKAEMEKPGLSEEERDAKEALLMIYDQFGDPDSMSAEEAVAAYEALRQRIWMSRFEWENIQSEKRAARRAVVRRIVEGVGSVSENEYNAKKRRVKPTKRMKNLGDVLAGMPAAVGALRGYLPLREMADSLTRRANLAGELIKQWEAERWIALETLSKQTMGKSWRLCMDYMHKVLPTGVAFERPVYRTVDIKVPALRSLLEMDKKARVAEMKRRREAGGKEAETALSERDIEAAAQELARMDEAGEAKGWVHAKYLKEIRREENLELSRGEALYAILMYEQPTYTERMEAQGYTPEVIAGLRKFIGEGMLEFGYGLRELFRIQGDKIAAIYEREFGVPFPREENYFAARWDVTEMKENPAEQLLAGMAGTPGAGNGWMKQRVNHNLELDMTKDALQVFLQATTLTDTWMATQDIVADFKAWTRDKDFARALTALLGEESYTNLKDWIRILEQGGAQDCLNMGVTQDVINGLYGSGAVAILGLRVQTLIRQVPSVFNGMLGASDITAGEWFATLARMKHGDAPMTFKRMKDSVLMKNRRQGRAGNMASQAVRSGDTDSSVTEEFLQAAMLPMEWMDASCTAMSLVPVWNVYYDRAVRKGASHQEAEQAAWEQTTVVANFSSQPIGWLNKSKIAQSRNPIVKSMFYMLSENTAKFALCRALWKGSNKKAAVRAWLVYGAANAAISALLDYLQGDPDEWEKGEWWEYVLSALYGPAASLPGVGEALEALGTLALNAAGHVLDIEALQKAKARASVGRALIDVGGTWRAMRKLYEFMTDDQEHTLAEYTRAASTISRTMAIGTGWMGNMVGYWSTALAVLTNPVDFVARVYRNMKQYYGEE